MLEEMWDDDHVRKMVEVYSRGADYGIGII